MRLRHPGVDLSMPARRPASPVGDAPTPFRVVLDWGRRYRLWCFDLGLACCAVEFLAATSGRHDLDRLGVNATAPGPREADLLVVSGTVTDKLAPAVLRVYEQMPGPKHVISFGSCANSGGPYWDSYCVTKGVDQLLPVDVYVPGCPPRPEALLQGLLRLHASLSDQDARREVPRGGDGVGRGARRLTAPLVPAAQEPPP